MALICPSSCGTPANVITPYNGCSDVFRRFGSKFFILYRCDLQFTDILDSAEWTTHIGNDMIHIGPPGILLVNDPTVTSFELEGCGREAVGEVEYTIDFSTYQTKDDLSDYDYYASLFDDNANWRLGWYNCSDEFIMEDDWAAAVAGGAPATVSGTTPGFEFSIVNPPHAGEGEAKRVQWRLQFKIKKEGILRAEFLPGVIPVLG